MELSELSLVILELGRALGRGCRRLGLSDSCACHCYKTVRVAYEVLFLRVSGLDVRDACVLMTLQFPSLLLSPRGWLAFNPKNETVGRVSAGC